MTTAKISENSNLKLGPLIHSWSLPAGKEFSCPGETTLCGSRCYAKRGHFNQRTTRELHQANWLLAHKPEFGGWMRKLLRDRGVRVCRIHVSGDFFDLAYIRHWQFIVSTSPRVQFFAYTRSWRQEEQFPALVQLSQNPNMQLWWSIDRQTGPAPLVRGIRRAYMAINDADARYAPDDCDLVFRDRPKTVMKKANTVLVCPPENGVTTTPKITCSRCGICWGVKPPQWEKLFTDYIHQDSLELVAPTM